VAGNYQKAYEESINNREKFWGEAAKDIEWQKEFTSVLDATNLPFYKWFPDGELNICYNALDYHVNSGRANQIALIYDSPVTNTIKKYTYAELLDQVSRFAGVLTANGVSRGDRVIIYMPMIPESVVAMLACARIGAIHSVVFGGFASRELAIRIDDAKPKLVISASCGIEAQRVIKYKPLLDKAIELSRYKPEKCIVYQREQVTARLVDGRDFDWAELMKDASPVGCTMVKSIDPLYILYTSGTTGMPKGVVRDNGGYAVALKWSMKNIYDMKPGEVYWAASDVGWVVGHSYIVYAPLLYGCTTILYEGKPIGTPDPGAFWRVISQHKVKALFVAPTALRAIKKEDPDGKYLKKYNISHFKYLFPAGERLDPDTYYWASNLLGVPVIDHWWQTETGWAIAANCIGLEHLPVKAGSPTKPVPGYEVEVLDSSGNILPSNNEGIIAIKLPLPPGTLLTLWQKDRNFKESYLDPFPGYYFTGDGGYVDSDGYIYVMGRVDDVINVAGHRLSTGAMEEVISAHPEVAECAVVGIKDEYKGQLPLGFVVVKSSTEITHAKIVKELIQMVREQIGAVASFKQAVVVTALPKTRSGKILRGVMRKIADGEAYKMPSTIEDASVLVMLEGYIKTLRHKT